MDTNKQATNLLMKKRYSTLNNLISNNTVSYKIGMDTHDKRTKIATYLIHQTLLSGAKVNMFMFSKRSLAKKFHCSKMTVSRAINALKHIKEVNINDNFISLNTQKEDEHNA